MGRQIQLHVLPKDVNELLGAMDDREPLQLPCGAGIQRLPVRLVFIPEDLTGQTLVV